jgi:protein-S-isoprenylcysteine O-methyltransferase Ste14
MSLIPTFEIGVWNAWIFMAAFLVYVFVLARIYRGITGKMGHGEEEKKINRLLLPVMLLLALYSVFLPLVLWTAWFYTGLALFILGLVLVILTVSEFAAAPGGEVVTGGVYRFSRHPFYLGYSLVFLGTGIASASWLFLLVWAVLIGLMHIVIIAEEESMAGKHGNAYLEYVKKTPRWIGLPRKVA